MVRFMQVRIDARVAVPLCIRTRRTNSAPTFVWRASSCDWVVCASRPPAKPWRPSSNDLGIQRFGRTGSRRGCTVLPPLDSRPRAWTTRRLSFLQGDATGPATESEISQEHSQQLAKAPQATGNPARLPDCRSLSCLRLVARPAQTGNLDACSADRGVDVIILDGPGDKQAGIEVKRWHGKMQVQQIPTLAGALLENGFPRGVFVTTSAFTKGARKAANTFLERGYPIELVDGDKLHIPPPRMASAAGGNHIHCRSPRMSHEL